MFKFQNINHIISKECIAFMDSIIKATVMFMTIYSFCPIYYGNIGIISTLRISMLVSSIYIIFKGKVFLPKGYAFNTAKYNICFQVCVLFYSLFVTFVAGEGDGISIHSSIFSYIVNVPILCLLFYNMFDSKEQFLKSLLIATIFQSVIITLGLFNESCAKIIDNCFMNKDIKFSSVDFASCSEMRLRGYPCGLQCITSQGVLKLSLGLLSCLYFYLKQKYKYKYLLLYCFISLSMTAVARTGLVIACVGLFALLCFLWRYDRPEFKRLLSITACFCVFSLGYVYYWQDQFNTVFKRLSWFFTDPKLVMVFFETYYNGIDTRIPPLCIETMFGTGMLSGKSYSGLEINADGNFARIYSAIGLPFAIVFYTVIFLSFGFLYNKFKLSLNKICLFMFFCIFLIGEFKEPFFYSKYFFAVFYTCVLLINKEEVALNERN